MNQDQRASFEAWYMSDMFLCAPVDTIVFATDENGYYVDSRVQASWRGYQAALQSQDAEEVMEMTLCESRQLVLRIGQAYRFVPMGGCKTCEEMKAEHDQAYAIDHARRIEGES